MSRCTPGGAGTFNHQVFDTSGHNSQGDVEGVEADPPAGSEIEHRSISQQVNSAPTEVKSFDEGQDFFMRGCAQGVGVDLVGAMAYIKEESGIFQKGEVLLGGHHWGTRAGGAEVANGQHFIQGDGVIPVIGSLQGAGGIYVHHGDVQTIGACCGGNALAP